MSSVKMPPLLLSRTKKATPWQMRISVFQLISFPSKASAVSKFRSSFLHHCSGDGVLERVHTVYYTGGTVSAMGPHSAEWNHRSAEIAVTRTNDEPPGTARLKWKKWFLARGFPIFWPRWSNQTFSISLNITMTGKTFCWSNIKFQISNIKYFCKNRGSKAMN